MKKPRLQILILITCVFAAFLSGFFVGRNFDRTPVQIRTLPAPTQSAAAEPAVQADAAPEQAGIININTATAEQLQTLPGIGQVLAQRIIDYRDTYGPFGSIGELANVSGLGEKKLEAIWDLVTIGGSS